MSVIRDVKVKYSVIESAAASFANKLAEIGTTKKFKGWLT